MAFKFNHTDSVSAVNVEHDTVMENIDGVWVETTEDKEGEEDDPEVR